jgi:hypothetical protein
VRAYHVGERELLSEPIVDPSEPDEPMTGRPLTRATSRDGRWAYTLYDSPGHPFVHALDTEEATARCIDLHALAGRDDLLAIRLTVGRDGTIEVRHAERTEPLLEIEPAGFTVSEPRPSERTPAPKTSDRWPLIFAGLAPLALIALIARHTRRPGRSDALPEPR